MKRGLFWCLVWLMGAAGLEGAEVDLNAPVLLPSTVALQGNFANDDNGAVYDEAEVFVYQELAQRVFALGNASSATVDEMLNTEWALGFDNTAGGDITNGWTITSTGGGKLELTNSGDRFLDVPTYDVWNTSASSDTARTVGQIGYGLLERNGEAGYQAIDVTGVELLGWRGYEGKDCYVAKGEQALRLIEHASYVGPYEASDVVMEEGFVGSEGGALGLDFPATSERYLLFDPEADFDGMEGARLEMNEGEGGNWELDWLGELEWSDDLEQWHRFDPRPEAPYEPDLSMGERYYRAVIE